MGRECVCSRTIKLRERTTCSDCERSAKRLEKLEARIVEVLGCDYFGAYRKYMRKFGALVQFCMAHLIRDVKFLITLADKKQKAYGPREQLPMGRSLLAQEGAPC